MSSGNSKVLGPEISWNLPASQLSQAVLTPAAALYLPAAQSMQTEAPAPEHVPAAQLVQTEAPAAAYVPATQLVQGDKFEQICRKPVVHFLKTSPQAVGTS